MDKTTTQPTLPADAYENHNWMVLSLVAHGTPLANEAVEAIRDLWCEIDRLRALIIHYADQSGVGEAEVRKVCSL